MSQVIRKSKLNISSANIGKLNFLDSLIDEYQQAVNSYIELFYKQNDLPKYSTVKVETWLSVRMQRLASTEALQILRSVRTKERKKRYKKYKRTYAICKENGRFPEFTGKKFRELNLKFKKRPIYHCRRIRFHKQFLDIQFDNNSFDMWIRFKSLGKKRFVKVPVKRHRHFNKLLADGFEIKESGTLYKKNNKYYFDICLEKEVEERVLSKEKAVGIDLGIDKLLSTSDNQFFGLGFKELLKKLNRRKQKSKNWNKTVEEIKNYISRCVNELKDSLDNCDYVVLENLKNISRNTKKKRKVNKTTRRYLSRWNRSLILQRIKDFCDLRGSQVVEINPSYTSQTCPRCDVTDSENRKGEIFKCVKCGYEDDSDHVGALNILSRFYEEFTVSHSANKHLLNL